MKREQGPVRCHFERDQEDSIGCVGADSALFGFDHFQEAIKPFPYTDEVAFLGCCPHLCELLKIAVIVSGLRKLLFHDDGLNYLVQPWSRIGCCMGRNQVQGCSNGNTNQHKLMEYWSLHDNLLEWIDDDVMILD